MATQVDFGFREHERNGKLRSVRQQLLDQAAELRGEQRALKELLPVDLAGVKDEEETCVDRLERDVASMILEMTARMARDVDLALRRLDTGDYGRCEECGQPIPTSRLRALPFAPRCRVCQESTEAPRPEPSRPGEERL